MQPSARSTGAPSRRTPPPAAILLVCSVALVAVALPVTVAAAPPPEPLCGVCGSDLEGATGAGTLDVHVDEAGDSRWVARVPVDEAAAAEYRADPAALDAAVAEGWSRWATVQAEDAPDREAAVETVGGEPAVVVSYAVADVARSGVGDARLLEYLYAGGTQTRYDLAADRATIHAPDGYAITNSPANAAIDGDTVTWTRDGGDPSRTAYVTYGPEGATVTNALESRATAGAAFGPLVLEHGLLVGLVPAVIAGIGTVAVAVIGREARYAGVGSRIGGLLSAPGVAVLGRAADALGGDRPAGFRACLGLAVGAAAAVGLGSWLVVGPATGAVNAPFALAAGCFLPLGYALERGSAPWPLAVATVAAPVAGTTAVGPYYGSREWLVFLGLVFVPAVIVVLIVGYPLSLVGRRLARTDGT